MRIKYKRQFTNMHEKDKKSAITAKVELISFSLYLVLMNAGMYKHKRFLCR